MRKLSTGGWKLATLPARCRLDRLKLRSGLRPQTQHPSAKQVPLLIFCSSQPPPANSSICVGKVSANPLVGETLALQSMEVASRDRAGAPITRKLTAVMGLTQGHLMDTGRLQARHPPARQVPPPILYCKQPPPAYCSIHVGMATVNFISAEKQTMQSIERLKVGDLSNMLQAMVAARGRAGSLIILIKAGQGPALRGHMKRTKLGAVLPALRQMKQTKLGAVVPAQIQRMLKKHQSVGALVSVATKALGEILSVSLQMDTALRNRRLVLRRDSPFNSEATNQAQTKQF